MTYGIPDIIWLAGAMSLVLIVTAILFNRMVAK